jgi:hypothetical protein
MAKPSELLAPKKPKRALLYTLTGMVCIGAIGLLQWIDELAAGWLYLLAALLMLVVGTLHARLMYRLSGQVSDPGDFGAGLMLTLQLALAGGVLLFLVYRMLHLDLIFATILIFFLIPFLFLQAWYYLDLIPVREYKMWFYPMDQEMPDLDFVDLSQIEVIQFVFKKRTLDPSATNFTSKAPLEMPLAQLFFIFINDYNEKNSLQTIEFASDKGLPYGWLFYRKVRWPRRRHFHDPDQSFRQNAVRPGEWIYAERVALALPSVEIPT